MAGEGKLQSYLFARCKEHDIYCRKIKFEGRRGCPDVMIAYEGHVVLIELKNPNEKGELSKLQEHELADLREHGVVALVLSQYDEVDRVIQKLIE